MNQPSVKPIQPDAHIATVEADFLVTSPNGPLSTPESLLAAVRAEVLPALSDVLEAAPFVHSSLTLPHLEIDLGTWPDEPNWPELRLYLAQKLRSALLPYLATAPVTIASMPPAQVVANRPDTMARKTSADHALSTAAHETAPAPRPLGAAFVDGLNARSGVDQLAALLAHIEREPANAKAVVVAVQKTPRLHAALRQTVTRLDLGDGQLDRLLETWSNAPTDVMRAVMTRASSSAAQRDALGELSAFGDALNLHRGLLPLTHRTGPAQMAGIAQFIAQTPNADRALAQSGAAQVIQKLTPAASAALRAFSDTKLKAEARSGAPTPQQSGPESNADLLQHLPTLPPTQQMAQLLHFLAHRPAALEELQASHHRAALQLCAPQVMDMLTAPRDVEKPAQTLRALTQVVENAQKDSPENAPQTVSDWIARAMELAPDLALSLPGAARASGHIAERRDNPSATIREAHGNKGSNKPNLAQYEAQLQLSEALKKPGISKLEAQARAARMIAQWVLITTPEGQTDARRDDDALASLAQAFDTTRKTIHAARAEFQQSPLDHRRDLHAPAQTTPSPKQPPAALAPDLEALRWATSAQRMDMLADLPDALLKHLALELAPRNANALRARLQEIVDDPQTSSLGLRDVVVALLEGKGLDFEALSADQARMDASPGSDEMAEAADSDVGQKLSKPSTHMQSEQQTSPDTSADSEVEVEGESGSALNTNKGAFTRIEADTRSDAGLGTSETPPTHLNPEDLEQLRRLWRAAPTRRELLLADLSERELRLLARNLAPPQANALRARLFAFVNDPETPRRGVRDAVDALLSGEPLDFETLGAAPSLGTAFARLTGSPDVPRLPAADPSEPLQVLLDAALSGDTQVILQQIWKVWPHSATSDDGSSSVEHDLTELLLGAIANPPAGGSRTDTIKHLLLQIEPDATLFTQNLRIASARLGFDANAGDRAVQLAARQVVEAILSPEEPRSAATSSTPDPTPDMSTHYYTDVAGIVILHPYLALLFERLEIKPENKKLPFEDLPLALAVLHAIVPSRQGDDPLLKLLLGLPVKADLPDPLEDLTEDATDMIDGLLRAVISQWGKLGATVPEGLRETFLQRDGAVELGDEANTLRVNSGPFDMLMDSLPWSLTPVKLPWMPQPLHVQWRDKE